jgi:hypothetical protein
VKNGNVTLEGIADSETDKNLVNIWADGVHGIFSVTNNLQMEKQTVAFGAPDVSEPWTVELTDSRSRDDRELYALEVRAGGGPYETTAVPAVFCTSSSSAAGVDSISTLDLNGA